METDDMWDALAAENARLRADVAARDARIADLEARHAALGAALESYAPRIQYEDYCDCGKARGIGHREGCRWAQAREALDREALDRERAALAAQE